MRALEQALGGPAIEVVAKATRWLAATLDYTHTRTKSQSGFSENRVQGAINLSIDRSNGLPFWRRR